MRSLSIDIETYSSADLAKCGVYKYAAAPDFEVLLFGYSVDGGKVNVVDLANGEKIPSEILSALTDETVIKSAFNASFERVCLSRYLGMAVGEYLDPESWHCDLVWSATLGLPLSLEGVGAVLGLDKQKLAEGKSLIKFFCVPSGCASDGGGRGRNMPYTDPVKWRRFIRYNARDVETELAIQQKLRRFPVPESIWKEYRLSERINDRGIGLDMDFVHQALAIDGRSRETLTAKMKALTNLDNPNSVCQLTGWLSENGTETATLAKKTVAELIRTAPERTAEVLGLRQQLAKSSVRKYTAMENAVCEDDRARGMFMYYGASRTGRFAGRLIQLQNLPQNHIPDLEQARSLVRSGNYAALEMLYEDIPDTLSQLIRTAFVPQYGRKFIVADFSAIEARVLAWLAGEKWRQAVFAEGRDIYCSSASQMFGVPVEKHGINGHLRQKGKIAELALGYGGSVGALRSMGAIEMGVDEEELQPLVTAWRNSNPNITFFWWSVDEAVKTCVKQHIDTEANGIRFQYQSGLLFIVLPSGRKLAYVKPRIGKNKFGGESVVYEGTDSSKKWSLVESYGPKFCENITQAVSRDILMYAMRALQHCDIVAHVHDEIIIEIDRRASVKAVCEQMSRTPPWAKGLLLRADGYECDFYRKD